MAGAITSITYEVNRIPVELPEERDWRRAIERRRIRRETPVTVYRAGEPPRVERAEDVPELRSLFDEIDPPATAAPPLEPQAVDIADQAPATLEPETRADAPDGALSPDASDQAPPAGSRDDTPPFAPAAEQAPPPPPGPGPNWRPLAAVAAIFALLILVLILVRSNRSTTTNVAQALPADTSNMTMDDTGPPESAAENNVYANAAETSMDTNMAMDTNMTEDSASNAAAAVDSTSNTVATPTRPLYVINRCQYYIEVWARYHNPDYGWQTAGPRRLNTGQSLDLNSDQADFYYYAQAPGTNVRWGPAGVTTYYGTQSMRSASASLNSRGSYYLELTCEGR